MKKFEPPTLEMVEDYVRAKNLNVDPNWWWNYFEAGDWHNKYGKPVLSWKQTLWTHHRCNMERVGHKPCKVRGCKGHGVYVDGKDHDGHPYYKCINHKPTAEPATISVDMKKILPTVNFHDERNKQLRKIGQ